ncbi:MAG TPA: CBS domain-containing protein [Candidatus Saccharimonadales bacterium]|nr:CBS domain-containing protein [Candidatus Saccharimonadales bacterium]
MNSYLTALILLLAAVAGVVARKTYYYLPARELKRRAERDDPLASRLYPAVAYGSSLRGLLWVWIGLASAGGFVLLARIAPPWLSLIAVILLLWVTQSWLPASRVTRVGAHLTAAVTPVIVWLLHHLHPLSSRATETVGKRYTAEHHTGLFERGDLLELIEQQQRQPDNRLSDEELEMVRRSLSFGDYKVSEAMTPRRKVKTALAGDTIGPVLIDELHKNGQGYMLVRDKPKGDFVGSLAFRQLSIQTSGRVGDVMDPNIAYLHENDPLSQAFHAFSATSQPLFVVVNSSEEYVGIVTIDNILRQLLGHLPADDFDRYGDSAAVAARHVPPPKPKKAAKKPQKDKEDTQDKAEAPEDKADEDGEQTDENKPAEQPDKAAEPAESQEKPSETPTEVVE